MEKPIAQTIEFFPPERVVIATSGAHVAEAIGYRRARARGVEPALILIRKDAWTLGARLEDAEAAYAAWPELWICFAYLDRGPPAAYWRLERLDRFGAVVRTLRGNRTQARRPPSR